MAANMGRKSCTFSSIFVRLLCEKQPVLSLGRRQSIQFRNLSTSEMLCGGRLKSEWRRKRAPALTTVTMSQLGGSEAIGPLALIEIEQVTPWPHFHVVDSCDIITGKLCLDKPEKYKSRKAFGGGEKTKVTRAKEGLYNWKSQEIEFQTPILDVLHNTAHKDFTERKIMVQGTVVEIDGQPFKTWYEDVYLVSDDIKEGEEVSPVDDRIVEQLQSGKVLAKVSSRPGQEGKVNGYLLEGLELSEYLEIKRTSCDGNL